MEPLGWGWRGWPRCNQPRKVRSAPHACRNPPACFPFPLRRPLTPAWPRPMTSRVLSLPPSALSRSSVAPSPPQGSSHLPYDAPDPPAPAFLPGAPASPEAVGHPCWPAPTPGPQSQRASVIVPLATALCMSLDQRCLAAAHVLLQPRQRPPSARSSLPPTHPRTFQQASTAPWVLSLAMVGWIWLRPGPAQVPTARNSHVHQGPGIPGVSASRRRYSRLKPLGPAQTSKNRVQVLLVRAPSLGRVGAGTFWNGCWLITCLCFVTGGRSCQLAAHPEDLGGLRAIQESA